MTRNVSFYGVENHSECNTNWISSQSSLLSVAAFSNMKYSQFMLFCSLPLVAGRRLQVTGGSIFNLVPITPITDSSKSPTKPPEGETKPPTKPPDGTPTIGSETKPPTKPPDGAPITPTGPIYGDRSAEPSFAPSESCILDCKVDADCPQVCKLDYPFEGGGTCVSGVINFRPTLSPSEKPTFGSKECPCDNPKTIPTKCEVDILIDMMDIAVQSSVKNLGQWVRMSFHDAGTFDQTMPEGGANGCLLNDPSMSGIFGPPENQHMDDGILSLKSIKNDWHAHPQTCIKVSSADMLQFAAFFAATRQKFVSESISSSATSTTAIQKRDTLKADFVWGRPDEANCETAWTDNLPGFNSVDTQNCFSAIPCRCAAAGNEIVEKMINRNGFTAEEANVLIGAHTMGMVRGTFITKAVGPWVENGGDTFPGGPIFDNAYHDFLVNTIVANDIPTFAQSTVTHPFVNVAPFNEVFPNWFLDEVSVNPIDLIHLDTDITLAFEPDITTAHPDFSVKTNEYANSNAQFLQEFFMALDKMSKLGVTAPLFPATECKECDFGAVLDTGDIISFIKNLGNATSFADQATAELQIFRTETGVIEKLTTPVLFTRKPSPMPTSAKPTSSKPTTSKPSSSKPTSAKPVIIQTKSKPTTKPTTSKPTTKPTTHKPTKKPTTSKPTKKPATSKPTKKPTAKPTSAKPVIIQTAKPTSAKPVIIQTAKPVIIQSSSLKPTEKVLLRPPPRSNHYP